jgi:hypothetical protein
MVVGMKRAKAETSRGGAGTGESMLTRLRMLMMMSMMVYL